ncbi:MAG: hypothetical protein ABFD92_20400 [Planctomycetaceae bacterium]|nr:hypothetical protein [Planctomycetaceae bacterium]
MVTVRNNWVEFSFFRDAAKSVFVAGDFNGWRQDELRMSNDGRGNWQARLKLPVGEFKFRYCADGQWFTDYAAFGLEPGRFGMDSIVRVPEKSPALSLAPIKKIRPAAVHHKRSFAA